MFWKHTMHAPETTIKLSPEVKMPDVVNYDEKLAKARETLKQMGIVDIKPLIGLKRKG